MKKINIKFPFRESGVGDFVALTTTHEDAVRSDLIHLILTQKGTRYYLPEFGTNLVKFIFEPNDGVTLFGVEQEIKDAVTRYLPNLTVNKIDVKQSEVSEYAAEVRIDYTVTEDVFETKDFIILKL